MATEEQTEIVDPIEQLVMSLKWEDDVQEQYKRRTVIEAILFVAHANPLRKL